jgi:endonuclease III
MGGANTFRLSKRARTRLEHLDRVLDVAYGAPAADLENKEDPLEEAIYIILSFQTNLERFKQVWGQLRVAFPSWDSMVQAPLGRISRVLRVGGLQEQRARRIKNLLKAVKRETGSYSLDVLRQMDDEEAERFLTRLPGLSWKASRCVLLYSLDRDVFPIDGNTFRVLKRVGVLDPKSVYRRRSLHDGLQDAVDPSRRKSFHINLVVHGHRTCLPRHPRCSICVARKMCAMQGVPADLKTQARRSAESGSGVAMASQTRALV